MGFDDAFVRDPKLDPTAIGISFVDILFALVVGQILEPVARWMTHPHHHRIVEPSWFALAVALVLTITSWIGYHNSSNAAHFRLQFINVELVKFCFDIAMVVTYYLVAANAARHHPSLSIETGLVSAAFVLYFLWDIAGAYQKRQTGRRWEHGCNPYYKEWEQTRINQARADVPDREKWLQTNWPRVWTTFVALLVSSAIFGIVLLLDPSNGDQAAYVVVNSALLVLLLAYRIVKEIWKKAPELEGLPGGGAVATAPSGAAVVTPDSGDKDFALTIELRSPRGRSNSWWRRLSWRSRSG